MAVTYVNSDVLETIDPWTTVNAYKAIFKAFSREIKTKKKYTKELTLGMVEQVLTDNVGPVLKLKLKAIITKPDALRIYTDSPFLSFNTFLKLEWRIGKIKKNVKLEINWKAIEREIKDYNSGMANSFPTVESDERARRNKPLTEWVVFSHPNLIPKLQAKVGAEVIETLGLSALPVSVVIRDTKALAALQDLQDQSNVLQKIKDAADWDSVVEVMAVVLNEAAALLQENPNATTQAEDMIREELEQTCADVAVAAVGEIDRTGVITKERRKYVVVSTLRVVGSVVGIVAGVVGLALIPLTGGASLAFGAIGLWRGAVQLGDTLGKLSLEAEDTARLAMEQMSLLAKAYANASNTVIGITQTLEEFGKFLVPTDLIPSIKGVGGHIDNLRQKTNGLELNANKLSSSLSQALNKQGAAQRKLEEFFTDNAEALTEKEITLLTGALEKLEGLAAPTTNLIKQIIDLNERVAVCRAWNEELAGGYEELSSRQPTWSKVAGILIPLLGDAALAGAAGIGGADKIFGAVGETVKVISDSTSVTVGSISNAYDGITGLAELIQTRR